MKICDLRKILGSIAVPNVGAIHHTARRRLNRFRASGYRVGDVEPVHIQQPIENPKVVSLELLHLEVDDQIRRARQQPPHHRHVLLGYSVDEAVPDGLRGLAVVRVLREAQTLQDEELSEVHYDACVVGWYI